MTLPPNEQQRLSALERKMLRDAAEFVLAGEWPWEPEKDRERNALESASEKMLCAQAKSSAAQGAVAVVSTLKVCDCDERREKCAMGRTRTLLTAGFARCAFKVEPAAAVELHACGYCGSPREIVQNSVQPSPAPAGERPVVTDEMLSVAWDAYNAHLNNNSKVLETSDYKLAFNFAICAALNPAAPAAPNATPARSHPRAGEGG